MLEDGKNEVVSMKPYAWKCQDRVLLQHCIHGDSVSCTQLV